MSYLLWAWLCVSVAACAMTAAAGYGGGAVPHASGGGLLAWLAARCGRLAWIGVLMVVLGCVLDAAVAGMAAQGTRAMAAAPEPGVATRMLAEGLVQIGKTAVWFGFYLVWLAAAAWLWLAAPERAFGDKRAALVKRGFLLMALALALQVAAVVIGSSPIRTAESANGVFTLFIKLGAGFAVVGVIAHLWPPRAPAAECGNVSVENATEL